MNYFKKVLFILLAVFLLSRLSVFEHFWFFFLLSIFTGFVYFASQHFLKRKLVTIVLVSLFVVSSVLISIFWANVTRVFTEGYQVYSGGGGFGPAGTTTAYFFGESEHRVTYRGLSMGIVVNYVAFSLFLFFSFWLFLFKLEKKRDDEEAFGVKWKSKRNSIFVSLFTSLLLISVFWGINSPRFSERVFEKWPKLLNPAVLYWEYEHEALKVDSIPLCEKARESIPNWTLSKNFQVDRCFQLLFKKTHDIDLCRFIGVPESNYPNSLFPGVASSSILARSGCIQDGLGKIDNSKLPKYASYCGDINDTPQSSVCYSYVADRLLDPIYCGRIGKTDIRDRCYGNLAEKKNDEAYLSEIKAASIREEYQEKLLENRMKASSLKNDPESTIESFYATLISYKLEERKATSNGQSLDLVGGGRFSSKNLSSQLKNFYDSDYYKKLETGQKLCFYYPFCSCSIPQKVEILNVSSVDSKSQAKIRLGSSIEANIDLLLDDEGKWKIDSINCSSIHS